MSAMTRREFFQKTAADGAVAGFLAAGGVRLHANPLGLPIGSQTYPHRARIQSRRLRRIAEGHEGARHRGHRVVQPGLRGFSSLADGKQTRKILDDNGMKCLSAHFQMNALRTDQAEADRVGAGHRHDADEHRRASAAA